MSENKIQVEEKKINANNNNENYLLDNDNNKVFYSTESCPERRL